MSRRLRRRTRRCGSWRGPTGSNLVGHSTEPGVATFAPTTARAERRLPLIAWPSLRLPLTLAPHPLSLSGSAIIEVRRAAGVDANCLDGEVAMVTAGYLER